ncbi:conserved exported hypothetical protein [Methylocella tundrae]|uniref:Uncharacterized protein n=1 Tax=Methylocella tundrae TaxID=227605 RepID=A0A8B6MCA2_METTU|nr:hypothetical protein [Methylocella tundrae]VTZ23870.1 conserved exported hypothetical protein [Methylocella tundrae]VTZ51728.1 conserved exported hypothetical protein [Methylocella tundrae]
MPITAPHVTRCAASAFGAALAFGVALALPALADEPRVSPLPKPELTLQNFGRLNPDCLEWTNGCAVCRRLEPRQARANHPWSRRGLVKITCSTPGIACQPRELVCEAKRSR